MAPRTKNRPKNSQRKHLTSSRVYEKFGNLLEEEAQKSHTNTPPRDIAQVVEHFFRQESGKMVATLTGIFGPEHLTLAEDVVQEALARALQTWPFYGLPENPSAWVMRTARNLALDVVRRQKTFRDKEPEVIRQIEEKNAGPFGAMFADQEIADDRLRLIFVCCHPQIPSDVQVALALKTLCGFGVTEIARAFLTTDAAIAKRLTRAKQKIIEAKIPFKIPEGAELNMRLNGVLQSLYLLFNEGYKASVGDRLVREDICAEAIRLTDLLATHPGGNQPKTHALLALMLLSAARTPARTNAEGHLLRLRDQDRSLWDKSLIARGMREIALSAEGGEISEYHLQAAVAACHCYATNYESTDWGQILLLYDRLLELDYSPVVALNRAVVFAEINGPQPGIEAVHAIENRKTLEDYYLYHAVLGDFESQLGRLDRAAANFRKALELTEIKSEQDYLAKRLQACEPVMEALG